MRGTVECIDAVKYYVDELRTKAGIYIAVPIIKFDLRGTTAGRAWGRRNVIQFNPILLDQNPEVFVRQTVGHEVAHLAAFVKHGNCDPHGQEWRHVMWALGLPAKRCHNYDVSTITGRRPVSLAREVLE
jgi:SprT protein